MLADWYVIPSEVLADVRATLACAVTMRLEDVEGADGRAEAELIVEEARTFGWALYVAGFGDDPVHEPTRPDWVRVARDAAAAVEEFYRAWELDDLRDPASVEYARRHARIADRAARVLAALPTQATA